MKAAEKPADEQARLDTLRSLVILDTEPEERFDRVTRMARKLFDVPIALVSLVDANRQWFKSCTGLGIRQSDRDISFCGHAILGNGVFVIPDALEDARFADNPLVTGKPYIRFYAGCPFRAPNGHTLGTLCIIDRRPRTFHNEDLQALTDLAAMVEREIGAVQLATIDSLTQISNRLGFMTLARHCLDMCARQHFTVSLAFIDLNDFKAINDSYGHAEGDRALAGFAAQMRKVGRDADVLARLGGDEFAALMVNSEGENTVKLINRLHEALDQYNREAARGYDVGFSHGIVEYDPKRHDSIEALLAEGDALMYEVKKARHDGAQDDE
ncbi:MAG: GGDEF domain-containing protein [Salinisphaeraceae bacterium]|nr:GGDEF domain-containing protein [Salinisphaeraceae bacterium]